MYCYLYNIVSNIIYVTFKWLQAMQVMIYKNITRIKKQDVPEVNNEKKPNIVYCASLAHEYIVCFCYHGSNIDSCHSSR